MTTLADIRDAVYTITKRPDLVGETLVAIQRATLKEHAAIDYPKDRTELTNITLDNSAANYRYQLSLALLGITASCRKIDRIEEYLATMPAALFSPAGYYGQLIFEEIAANSIFDDYYLERQNYFFRQGMYVNIVAARQVDAVNLYYYQLPTVTELGYSSWIADMYPYVIYDAAAADIFKLIGKTDELAMYNAKMPDNRLDIIKSEMPRGAY